MSKKPSMRLSLVLILVVLVAAVFGPAFTANTQAQEVTATNAAPEDAAVQRKPTRTPVSPPTATPLAPPTATPLAPYTATPVTAPTAAPAGSHSLLLSYSSNRSNPAPLSSQTVKGNVYIFVSPETGASQVRFFIDHPAATGTPSWTENNPPWDFAGGTASAASPYNSANLADGPHSITASISLSAGGTTVTTAYFTVANGAAPTATTAPATAVPTNTPTPGAPPTAVPTNTPTVVAPTATRTPVPATPAATSTPTMIATVLAPTATPGAGYTIVMSKSSSRSSPVSLDGQTVSGNVYVFVSPETGASQVRFFIDNSSGSGTPYWTENNPPWDLAGGTVSAANPYNTANLSNGSHSITASITRSTGGAVNITANFTVNNGGSGTSCSAAYDQVHLAWVNDPSTTLTVVWRTCNTGTASAVQYRAAGSATWLSAMGSLRSSATAGTLHEVALAGLSPATSYEYRVQGDSGVWSPVFTARTAPAPGPATFDAIYYADTGLAGRTDGLASGTEQVVSEIARLNPLLVLPGGDYAYFDTDKRYGTLDNSIDAWFNQNQPIASKSVMMPTYGNHEVELGENVYSWIARFPSPAGYDSRRNYSFDVGDVHFISLDASTDSRGLTTGQKQWLESDMQAAKNAGKRWIIPYFHVSPFADGRNHSSNLLLRADVGPVFEKYGVKIALSSHDQAFERSYPLRDVPATNTRTSTSLTCYTMNDGTVYVKVSPGGKESNISGAFSPFASNPAPAWTAKRDNTMHHFTRLLVSPTGISVETYGVKGDGTPPVIVDSFRYTTGTCP